MGMYFTYELGFIDMFINFLILEDFDILSS